MHGETLMANIPMAIQVYNRALTIGVSSRSVSFRKRLHIMKGVHISTIVDSKGKIRKAMMIV